MAERWTAERWTVERWEAHLDRSAADVRPELLAEVLAQVGRAWHGEPEVRLLQIGPDRRARSRRPALLVASIVAVGLALGGVALVARRDGGTEPSGPPVGSVDGVPATDLPGSVVTTAPPDAVTTVPTSSLAATSGTGGTTTSSATPTTVTEAGSDLDAWVAEQLEAGRTTTYVITAHDTDARILGAVNRPATSLGRVVLAFPDGRVVDLPFQPTLSDSDVRLAVVGGRAAIVHPRGGPVRWWLLDASELGWQEGDDLGLGELPSQAGLQVAALGDRLLVGFSLWSQEPDGLVRPTEQRGALARPDGSVEPATLPPDGIGFDWTTTSGRFALLLGIDNGAEMMDPFTRPWVFDAMANEWSPVPDPAWLVCADGPCTWSEPHEAGDRHLEVAVPDGVVMSLPDGSIGRYDATTAAWTRLGDSPFFLAGPATALVGDRLVVAPMSVPWSLDTTPPGSVGVLDLATGEWTAEVLDVPDPPEGAFWGWDLRVDGEVVLLGDMDVGSGTLDAVSPAYRWTAAEGFAPATEADVARWTALAGSTGTVPTESVTALVTGGSPGG